jgi:hypothetical protein
LNPRVADDEVDPEGEVLEHKRPGSPESSGERQAGARRLMRSLSRSLSRASTATAVDELEDADEPWRSDYDAGVL